MVSKVIYLFEQLVLQVTTATALVTKFHDICEVDPISPNPTDSWRPELCRDAGWPGNSTLRTWAGKGSRGLRDRDGVLQVFI